LRIVLAIAMVCFDASTLTAFAEVLKALVILLLKSLVLILTGIMCTVDDNDAGES